MHSRIPFLGACLLLTFALPCAAQQMNLGPHDIGGRGCAACHAPSGDISVQPQWAGASLPGTEPEDAWSHSAVCLSCHQDVHVQVMELHDVGPEPRPSPIGPHPVNVRYRPRDQSLFPVALVSGEWQFIANPENPVTRLKLFTRSASDATPTVQCASCHDPHDYSNPHFLRDPYDASFQGMKFCRTCHAEQSNYQRLE